jgi:Putative transposase
MTLDPDEFIRRFLLHILPSGFHRIRHTGFLASSNRAKTIARIREMITPTTDSQENAAPDNQTQASQAAAQPEDDSVSHPPCPCCGGHMRITERFARGASPKVQPTRWPTTAIRIDTS